MKQSQCEGRFDDERLTPAGVERMRMAEASHWTLGATVLLIGMALFATRPAGAVTVDRPAADFTGGGPWFNTGGKPLTLVGLRGRVVAVEMWTAGCYNCRNVLPWLRQWDAKYRNRGLVVVGVHTPEFAHERSEQYVRSSIAELHVRYPVVMDNAYRIWRAYNNVYWPTLYLVDKKGIIRYRHIGEGAYEQTEQMIKTLLDEHV
jgi:thiol-disulfide isomerase/thioredoxin